MRLTIEVRSGVLYAAAAGLMTAREIAAIRGAIAARASGLGAAVLDFRRCAVAITPAEIEQLFQSTPRWAGSLAAAWVLPDAEVAASWRRLATRFALAGVLRFATHQVADAQRWALDQATRAGRRQALQ